MDKMKEPTINDQTTNGEESHMEQENANLPAQSSTNLPATPEQAAEKILRRQSTRSLPLLRFVKNNAGSWIFKIGEEVIAFGTEYFAFWANWKHGMVRWQDGKPVEERAGLVADGFIIPGRDTLDPPAPPKGIKDVWQLQHWLPMENVETGEFCVFVTGSFGGECAIEEVARVTATQVTAGRKRGNPIVALAATTFPSKEYGNVPRPKFTIVGWEDDSGKTATPISVPSAPPPPKPVPKSDTTSSGDMNDEIPF
jgi:hypothetical protein